MTDKPYVDPDERARRNYYQRDWKHRRHTEFLIFRAFAMSHWDQFDAWYKAARAKHPNYPYEEGAECKS